VRSPRFTRHGLALAAALTLAACHAPVATQGPPPQRPAPTATAGPAATLPEAIHWVRNSAEYKAATLQAFRLATDRVERAYHGRTPGTWAVVTDADETLLDNSQYQKDRAAVGGAFTAESWRAWVARRAAPAVPGAVEFTTRVHSLGGRVIVVTNRGESECPDTEINLRTVGLAVDAVLCRPEGPSSSKQPRFDQVASGGTGRGLPPLEIVLFVGDNILDFPGLSQDARSQADRLDDFGVRFIVIPNPMYGSWERNPYR
jgi:5'-nucleotidase (lipoprotein e(P4) family)